MGSESYEYFAPYQPRLEDVLQALRQREFRAGNYGFRWQAGADVPADGRIPEIPEVLQAIFARDPDGEAKANAYRIQRAALPQLHTALAKRLQPLRHPTLAEVMAAHAESGTGSILDIEHISLGRPRSGVAVPVPPEMLEERLGTRTPTRDDLGDVDLLDELGRGECYYAIIYKDGAPHEVWFGGWSSD